MSFECARRALYGENLSALNSTANIANGILNLALKGRELFTYLHALENLTIDQVTAQLNALPLEEHVLSVIWPL